MRLVIDIPEEKYQGIINMAEEILDASTFCSPRYLYKAVLNGIPLPKGHGRLIDADALNLPPEELIAKITIQYAPTIIEADKAESEDKKGGTQHDD